MASETSISNLALSHLGQAYEIGNLATERSAEAAACRRYFDLARDELLREFFWPFTRKIIALGLIEENPNTEWGYSYQYPSNCIFLRRILSGVRNETESSRIPYILSGNTTGLLVYTDQPDAEAEYSARITDPNLFPVDFQSALSFKLAYNIAPRVNTGDPFKQQERMGTLYAIALNNAQRAALHEQQLDLPPESRFVRGR